MKRKFAELLAFVLFICPILWIYGVAGALDLDRISMGQAWIRIAIGLAAFGFDAWLINHLGKEDKPMNCGKWKVTCNPIGNRKMYSVYRLKDVNEVDHSGNREYAGDWVEDRELAQIVADQLNCCIEDSGKEDKQYGRQSRL